MQNIQATPQIKHFSTLEITVLCSRQKSSYFGSGKEPAFGKNAQSKYCCAA